MNVFIVPIILFIFYYLIKGIADNIKSKKQLIYVTNVFNL